jgi:hypothetical protein
MFIPRKQGLDLKVALVIAYQQNTFSNLKGNGSILIYLKKQTNKKGFIHLLFGYEEQQLVEVILLGFTRLCSNKPLTRLNSGLVYLPHSKYDHHSLEM